MDISVAHFLAEIVSTVMEHSCQLSDVLRRVAGLSDGHIRIRKMLVWRAKRKVGASFSTRTVVGDTLSQSRVQSRLYCVGEARIDQVDQSCNVVWWRSD